MTRMWLALRGLRFHWPMHAATALGVAVATAVIVGALLVGDSVRGSLKQLTRERLGRIEWTMQTPHFIRAELARELQEEPAFRQHNFQAEAICILSHVTVERPPTGTRLRARASGVTLLGVDPGFWQLDIRSGNLPRALGRQQVAINRQLADELKVELSDRLTVRLPEREAAPPETPFGRRDAPVVSLVDLEIVEILPNRGFGRFALSASQQVPRLVYFQREFLMSSLDEPGMANAILVADSTESSRHGPSPDPQPWLRPRLTDLGLNLEHIAGRFLPPGTPANGTQTAWSAWQVTSRHMILSSLVETKLLQALKSYHPTPVFTYLANSIRKVGDPQRPSSEPSRSIPYSTMTALGDGSVLAPLPGEAGSAVLALADDEIALNAWAAEQLDASPGDMLEVSYFDPETTHGDPQEGSVTLRLAHVVPLTKPVQPFRRRRPAVYDRPPTRANDPDLTPQVEGITDRESMENWDPPFPFDQRRIAPADDAYWDDYRTTPKAFVSLSTGQRLWASRFGTATAIRIPDVGQSRQALVSRIETQLRGSSRELGLNFVPARQQGLQAAEGTTPFEYLFLGFSMFLLASAVMLVLLLLGLNVLLRTREVGVYQAAGWDHRSAVRPLQLELSSATLAGVLAGLILGVVYAAVMVYGLRTWWRAAVVTPFITLHVTPRSLAMGAGMCVLMAGWMIRTSLRKVTRREPAELLRGVGPPIRWEATRPMAARRRRGYVLAAVILAVVLSIAGVGMTDMAQAGTFFAAGASALVAGILAFRSRLESSQGPLPTGRMTLETLARTSASRNLGRSLLIVALTASASFLLIAIAAFRLPPTEEGTGGFKLIAESDRPLFEDFHDPGRLQQVFQPAGHHGSESDSVSALPEVLALSWMPGDDASCRNIFRPIRPRIVGVSESSANLLSQREPGFRFAAGDSGLSESGTKVDSWQALSREFQDGAIPVILDANTAQYSLKRGTKVGDAFDLDYGGTKPVRFRVVGLLSNSIFQGNLLIGDRHLHRAFPSVSGQRLFLVDFGPGWAKDLVTERLEAYFGDQGFDATDARKYLSGLLEVQNTYLSTFQALGALGLLLGTVGLAVVQIRNVIERRGELGMLASLGFSWSRIRQLMVLEHGGLFLIGLAIGIAAALVTVVPHDLFGGTWPELGGILGSVVFIAAAGLLVSLASTAMMASSDALSALRRQ